MPTTQCQSCSLKPVITTTNSAELNRGTMLVHFTISSLIQSTCAFWTWTLTSAPLLDFYLGFSGLISVTTSHHTSPVCSHFPWNRNKYTEALKKESTVGINKPTEILMLYVHTIYMAVLGLTYEEHTTVLCLSFSEGSRKEIFKKIHFGEEASDRSLGAGGARFYYLLLFIICHLFFGTSS